MFSTLSRKVQIQSMPITRASYIPRTSMQQPTSWLSRIKTSLGTWNARRFYQSLSELFAIKTKEEHEKHVQELQKASKPLSPTQAHLTHLTKFFLEKSYYTPAEVWEKELFLKNVSVSQIDEIIKQEKKFFDAGYKILYHSTQPLYYALYYIDTQFAILYKRLIEGQQISENIPLILRQPGIIEETQKESGSIRQKFIEQGSTHDHFDRQYLLSCNPAVTSNITNPGECTLDYWDKRRNLLGINLEAVVSSLSGIAHRSFILAAYIKPYKGAIFSQSKKIEKSLKSGILLQIVFKDPVLAKECIYPAKSFGHKIFIDIENQKTCDITDIMESYSRPSSPIKPEDIEKLQYRIVLTSDKLLDVFNKNIYENFEIHAYANPQSALEEFHKEINNIMQKIEKDFYDKEVTARIEHAWDEKLKGMYMQKTAAEQLPSSQQEVLKEFSDKIEKEKELFKKFQEFNRKRFGQTIEQTTSKPEEL
jgi:hypothetical protein